MSSYVVALIYLLAIGIPAYLLYRFHAQSWFWHALAILAAFALGLLPTPPEFKTVGWDLAFGFTFIALMSWGIGGLLFYRTHATPHRQRHA